MCEARETVVALGMSVSNCRAECCAAEVILLWNRRKQEQVTLVALKTHHITD